MKDMAQLRLQAEVSQLEGRLQGSPTPAAGGTKHSSSDHPNLPPYLVPDAPSICEHLHQIKQLTNSARFILIIPLAGTCDTVADQAMVGARGMSTC